MSNSNITNVSAVDGRYQSKLGGLADWLSEFGLIKQRVRVEVHWLMALASNPEIPEIRALQDDEQDWLRNVVDQFSVADAESIKAEEAITNHDVKAVEYFVKKKLDEFGALSELREWVHFGCTSEDINNTAYGLMLKGAVAGEIIPHCQSLIETIDTLAASNADVAMLSRTHGQTASPTTLGKELRNVAARLHRQLQQIQAVQYLGKFNGAVGNYNAHLSAYPDVNWPEFSQSFLTDLGLTYNPWTTQIEPHDYIAELFHCLIRFNQIVLDFDRDIWSYISINYFSQKKVEGETGSSTMPHKINPIDFENSEGNIGVANAILDHLAQKLVVSRWQRDLSDSTALRNIGSALAHCVIAYQATLKGLSRLEVNEQAIAADIAESWEVLAEAVQTVMRKHGMREPYEQLKAATRGRPMDEQVYHEILETLNLPEEAYQQLKALRPEAYLGLAADLTRLPLD